MTTPLVIAISFTTLWCLLMLRLNKPISPASVLTEPLDTPNLPRSSAAGKPGARYDGGEARGAREKLTRTGLMRSRELAAGDSILGAWRNGSRSIFKASRQSNWPALTPTGSRPAAPTINRRRHSLAKWLSVSPQFRQPKANP